MTPPEDESGRTEAQKEWAAWAAHGYRKMYMPRSMRLFGLEIWERQKADWPGFAEYEEKTREIREIPVVVLERT
jgi:hypothetical protein